MKTSGMFDMGSSGSLDNPAENNRKSYQKHIRGNSESVVGINKDAAGKKSKCWLINACFNSCIFQRGVSSSQCLF